METKKCNKCGEIKSINEFYKDKTKKDGYRIDCKLCNNQRCKIYYKNNSTTIKQRAAQWSKNNRQRANEKTKQWKDKHRDKVRAGAREYYHNNKDKYKRYLELNRENINAWHRGYYKKNKPKLKIIQKASYLRNYEKNKYKYRERRKIWGQKNHDKLLKERQKRIIDLTDRYIKDNLIRSGWDKTKLNPDIIEEKRNIIKTKRIISKINQSINKKTKTL